MHGENRSKDTLVLSETGGDSSPMNFNQPSSRRITLKRTGNDLSSRVADNLYWLGRYAERSEDMARLLRSTLAQLTEEYGFGHTNELSQLLQILAHLQKI